MIEEPPLLTIRATLPRPSAAQIAAFQGVPTGFVADALGGGGALAAGIGPLGDGRDLPGAAAGVECQYGIDLKVNQLASA